MWSLPSRRGGRGTQFPPTFVFPRLPSEISNLGFSLLSIECTHTHTLPQPVATCGNFPPQCNFPNPAPPIKTKQKRRHARRGKKKHNGRLRSSATLKFRSAELKVEEGSSYGRTLKARRALGSDTEDLNSQQPLSPPFALEDTKM